MNLLENKPNQSTNFRTKICAGINDDSCGTYNTIVKLNLKLKC